MRERNLCRTLAVDTGKKLGYPAHMSDLTRTASAGMSQKDALTLEEVAQAVKMGQSMIVCCQ